MVSTSTHSGGFRPRISRPATPDSVASYERQDLHTVWATNSNICHWLQFSQCQSFHGCIIFRYECPESSGDGSCVVEPYWLSVIILLSDWSWDHPSWRPKIALRSHCGLFRPLKFYSNTSNKQRNELCWRALCIWEGILHDRATSYLQRVTMWCLLLITHAYEWRGVCQE